MWLEKQFEEIKATRMFTLWINRKSTNFVLGLKNQKLQWYEEIPLHLEAKRQAEKSFSYT